jgi:hypothetical protein
MLAASGGALVVWRSSLAFVLVLAAACGGAERAPDPSIASANDPVKALAVPAGPVLFKPEQIILPPEEFPLAGFAVSRDEPLTAHAWERTFSSSASPDFRWFTVRIFVLEPDVPSTKFIADNGCDTVRWPDELPATREIDATPSGDGARACRYEFADGLRVLYHTTGYRNVGIVVGVQPRRAEMTDRLSLDWLAAMARHQIAIIGRVLVAYPPPNLP